MVSKARSGKKDEAVKLKLKRIERNLGKLHWTEDQRELKGDSKMKGVMKETFPLLEEVGGSVWRAGET